MDTNWPAIIHIAEMAGITIFVGGLTVSGAALVMGTCLTPIACFAGVALMGPPTAPGAIGTVYLAEGTVSVFMEEFIVYTP